MATLTPAAKQIIEEFQDSAPVDVIGLATRLGLNVWEDVLPNDISGKISLDLANGGTSTYSIIVQMSQASNRKRFTIAHEIAHFILHRNLIGDGVSDDALYRSKLSSTVEAQANRLAADILMPFALISELQAQGITDLSDLASELQVSQQALKIRLGIPVVD
jgi:hypothetical protein